MRNFFSFVKESCCIVFALLGLTWTGGCTEMGQRAINDSNASARVLLYKSDWSAGVSQRLWVQANRGDIEVVDDPLGMRGKVLKVSINRDENFDRIANGVPRSEVLFPMPVRFAQGKEYVITWSTFLPPDLQFDYEQLAIIFQINQGHWLGGPTVALALKGNQYAISLHGGALHEKISAGKWLCCADRDKGHWVDWELHYKPDDTGESGFTRLLRDGALIFDATKAPNAYPGVQDSYLKIGIYKPDWKKQFSDVRSMSVLYGVVSVYLKQ